MDAPNPINNEIPNSMEIQDIKIIDIKSFDIYLSNNLFILELGKSEDKKNIIFKMYINNNLINNYYLLHLNINDFYNLNILFRLYQSIDEIYNLLSDILISKKYSIIPKDNTIILVLQFTIPGGKLIDIDFNLIGNKIKKEDLIEKLFSIVRDLLKENKLMKDEFNKKNNEIEKINNEIKYLKDENTQIKNELNNIKDYISKQQKEEKNNNDFNTSYIINNKKEKEQLKEWISNIGDIKTINLLYRATQDGDSWKDFISKCGEKGPTISLIKTKKGRRFGGFSKAEWTDKLGIVRLYDNNAFLFSLDNMKKYKILKPELAIGCYPNEDCLVYGNNGDAQGLCLYNKFLSYGGYENHSSKVYDATSDYCLSNKNRFYISEVEVYQIIFK